MKQNLRAVIVCALFAGGAASAQSVEVTLPNIRWEVTPPVVVVAEGVHVIPDYQEEVFFVDGWYWHRRGPHWFRMRGHRGSWVAVGPSFVPVRLIDIHPGKYRQYKHVHVDKKVVHKTVVHKHKGGGGDGRGKGGGGNKGHGGGRGKH
jgi:hypothetical protein